jgi:hypothetical protein
MVSADREISFTQETVRYHWNNVPEVKYDNWLRLRGEQFLYDTENFTAHGYPWMLQIEPTNMLCSTVTTASSAYRFAPGVAPRWPLS